jgi:ParB family transcriptional regulator, chromosome partitioning protein
MKKSFGLGKGLGSLIPKSKNIGPLDADVSRKENIFYVEVTKIRANPDQPRHDFDNQGLKDLSGSIRKYGVLQPLLVSKQEEASGNGTRVYYQLIAGERRLKAAQLAGIPNVPVVIRDEFKTSNQRLEVALIENIQRKDLNPIEEAEAYDKLQSNFGLAHHEIAAKVSKSREVISNSIRLLKLPNDMKDSLRAGILGRAQARALLAFNDSKKQREVFNHILGGKITALEIERIAASIKDPTNSRTKSKLSGRFLELQENLSQALNTPVMIHNGVKDKSGKMVIKFANLQELTKIAKHIID